MKVRPPAKPGACVSPERAYCRQASQEALKKSAACITCPAARKRAPFIQDYLSGNRKVVHLFPLRSMLEAKAFLLSPALLGSVISLKHTKQRPRGTVMVPRGRCFMLWGLGRGGAFTHRASDIEHKAAADDILAADDQGLALCIQKIGAHIKHGVAGDDIQIRCLLG